MIISIQRLVKIHGIKTNVISNQTNDHSLIDAVGYMYEGKMGSLGL